MYKNLKKVKDINLFQEKKTRTFLLNTNLTKNRRNTAVCRPHCVLSRNYSLQRIIIKQRFSKRKRFRSTLTAVDPFAVLSSKDEVHDSRADLLENIYLINSRSRWPRGRLRSSSVHGALIGSHFQMDFEIYANAPHLFAHRSVFRNATIRRHYAAWHAHTKRSLTGYIHTC